MTGKISSNVPNCDFTNVKCFICNKYETIPIVDGFSSQKKYTVSICKNDGLVFLNPRWSGEVYNRYYISEYDEAIRANIYHGVSDEYKFSTAKVIQERIKNLAKTDLEKILDIGSGMGWTLNYFHKTNIGKAYYAIEMSEFCINSLTKADVD